jgi:hypothetical protein
VKLGEKRKERKETKTPWVSPAYILSRNREN